MVLRTNWYEKLFSAALLWTVSISEVLHVRSQSGIL